MKLVSLLLVFVVVLSAAAIAPAQQPQPQPPAAGPACQPGGCVPCMMAYDVTTGRYVMLARSEEGTAWRPLYTSRYPQPGSLPYFAGRVVRGALGIRQRPWTHMR